MHGVVRSLIAGVFCTMAALGSPGQALGGDLPVESVRFDRSGALFKMIVTTHAPWTHWTLADPPRIILDLDDAVSMLPNAPGLYELELGKGTVRSFRSSQFNNQPGQRKVRMTLELSKAATYEAKRVGNEVHVSVRDDGTTTLPNSVDAAAVRSLTEALESVLDDAPSRRPTALESAADGAPRGPRPPSQPIQPAPPKVDGAANVEDPVKTGATPETKREVKAPDKASEKTPAKPESSTPAKSPAKTPAAPPKSSTPTAGQDSKLAQAAASSPDPSTEPVDPSTLARFMEPVMPAPLPARDLQPEPEDPSEPLDIRHARAAARLLREAADAIVDGDLEDASGTAERAVRFYGTSEGGQQAGLLWRELRHLRGEPVHERDAEFPREPDPRLVPVDAFVRLVELCIEQGDLEHAEQTMAAWESAYPRGEWTPRLHLALGEYHYRHRRMDRALFHLGFVDRGDPQEAAALLMSARLWDEAGDTRKALDLYRWLSELPAGPEQQRGLARSADLLFQSGKIELAASMYERAISSGVLEDERAWALYQSGNCQLLLGHPDVAEGFYEQVLDSKSESFWTAFAKERLESISWKRDLVRVMEETR